MDITKLSYTKKEADKEVLPASQQIVEIDKPVESDTKIEEIPESVTLSKEYTKQEGELSPAL